MKADNVNKWLTLGANFGVLIGILLLVVELTQNAVVMKAQISNERAAQAIELYMSAAENSELASIEAILKASDFPTNMQAVDSLSKTQKQQYLWYLKAQAAHIENILYQQSLDVVFDPKVKSAASILLPKLQAFSLDVDRIESLLKQLDSDK